MRDDRLITGQETLPHFQARWRSCLVTETVLADGQLILHGSEQEVEYIFEIKSDITNETAGTIANYFTHLQQKLEPQQRSLLITPQLSNRVVDQLIKANIEFVEEENARLRLSLARSHRTFVVLFQFRRNAKALCTIVTVLPEVLGCSYSHLIHMLIQQSP